MFAGPAGHACFSYDHTTVIPYHDLSAVTRLDAEGRVLSVRVPFGASMPAVPLGTAVGEPFSTGRRPDLRVPAHPLRVGDTWTDSMPTRLVRRAGAPQAPGAGMAHLTYRLKRLDGPSGARSAAIAISGALPWQPGDSEAVHCRARQFAEDLVLDVAARRAMRWTYTWSSRCDFGRYVTVGQTTDGYLVP